MSALCCSSREKLPELRAEQKWDYINLDEFKSTSCFTPLSYVVLFISLIISVSVYAVDTFTAINLLAFDRWSGQVKPAIPFTISRWIFAGCIILSFVLLFYRWLRAIKVMRAGGVAQSYLDPLAVRVQSVRMGKEGRGWKRFLVFAELTKGKKGADYVALFTYFSFEAWLRVLFAEGPRQVINAITLYSVMQLNLIPTGQHAAKDGHTPIVQFFVNIQALADTDRLQVVILFGMLFTVIVWVISVINLAVAVLLYIFFLFHHIPSTDGGLKSFCRRKTNKSVEKIVQKKVAKALKKENALRARQEAKSGQDGKRQPTLPTFAIEVDEKAGNTPLLSRTTTEATLPPYQPDAGSVSNLSLSRQAIYSDIQGRPAPTRTGTQASAQSYASNAPLLGNAGSVGYSGRPASPAMSPLGYGMRSESPRPSSPAATYDGRPGPPSRTTTTSTQSSERSYGPPRGPTPQGRQTPGNYAMGPQRTGTSMSSSSQGYPQPPSMPNSYQMGPIPRPGTANSMGSYMPRPGTANSMASVGRQPPGSAYPNNPYANARSPPPQGPPRGPPNNAYAPYNQGMRPNTPQGGPPGMPPRSMTQPAISHNNSGFGGNGPSYPPRSGTAPPQAPSNHGGYDDILNAY